MLGNLDVTVREGFKESRLTGAVLTQQTVALTIVKSHRGIVDQQTAVERHREALDVQVTALFVTYNHT